MTFYVEKSLAHGPIRFGVTPRRTLDQIDDDALPSTGPTGEFLRKRHQGFFFADTTPIGTPTFSPPSSISKISFFESMRPQDRRGWILVGLVGLGVILVIMGLAVVVNAKRWQGWIEVVIGAAMIATPIVITAKQRRDIRVKEDQERAIREEREQRHREMLGAYSIALEELRRGATPEALAKAARERQQLELPYKIWAPLARRTVLHVGFDAMSRLGPSRAKEVAQLMDRTADAVGLTDDDAARVKLDLYNVMVWHLLADDRLGQKQKAMLETIQRDFGISAGDAPIESQAMEEFDSLRGVRTSTLPRQQIPTAVKFHEYGIYTGPATLLGKREEKASIHLSNKRLIVDGRRKVEIPLSHVDDVEVDADQNTITVKAAQPYKSFVLRVDKPFYTAALIDLATNIDDRPRSFA